jgi:Zn-dependent peptidase ImmA (M78 family)
MARRLSRARQVARDLLVEVGARTPDQIDPIETAKEKGIEVTFGHLSGATARIYRIGTKARIRVSDQIVTEGRRRRAIMHEVGHYVLGHRLPEEGDLMSWFHVSCKRRNKSEERDADIVAIEHLTPEPMVKPYCVTTPVDLEAVRPIETVFRASRVMSAMRFAELSPESCAVVYSKGGRVVWMKPSRAFPSHLKEGTPLETSSLAGTYFANGQLRDTPQPRFASSWFPSSSKIAPNAELIEHAAVVPEPGWGGVLSMLWLPGFAQATKKDRRVPGPP